MSNKKGFFGMFGFGKDKAVVAPVAADVSTAVEDEDYDEESSNSDIVVDQATLDLCVSFLSKVLVAQAFDATVALTKSEGDRVFIEIQSESDLGRIIGKDGNHLEALQTLIRGVSFRKFATPLKIILDAGGYRRRRRNAVRSRAQDAVKKALNTGRSVMLQPMNSAERRMIHVMVENDERVKTSSKGHGYSRRVVISPR
jgi:spoIIIJ-associated protein